MTMKRSLKKIAGSGGGYRRISFCFLAHVRLSFPSFLQLSPFFTHATIEMHLFRFEAAHFEELSTSPKI